MPEPITFGALAAAALAEAAKAMIEGLAGDAVKSAYAALKAKISHFAGGDIDALERDPKNAKRQELIADEIERQAPEELAILWSLTSVLLEKLRQSDSQSPVAVDAGRRLYALSIRLSEIEVSAGRVLKADEIVTPGAFEMNKVTVGSPVGKTGR